MNHTLQEDGGGADAAAASWPLSQLENWHIDDKSLLITYVYLSSSDSECGSGSRHLNGGAMTDKAKTGKIIRE